MKTQVQDSHYIPFIHKLTSTLEKPTMCGRAVKLCRQPTGCIGSYQGKGSCCSGTSSARNWGAESECLPAKPAPSNLSGVEVKLPID